MPAARPRLKRKTLNLLQSDGRSRFVEADETELTAGLLTQIALGIFPEARVTKGRRKRRSGGERRSNVDRRSGVERRKKQLPIDSPDRRKADS